MTAEWPSTGGGGAPSGAAGGDLAGSTYPNPVIAAGAVTSAKILDGTIAVGDLAFDPATQAELDAAVALLAPLASPALTGSPTAPTKTAGDNSGKLATTAYVDGLIGRGTSFPGAPFDGQKFIIVADATLGVEWMFSYRSASASTYKWEFIGGAPMVAEVNNAAYPGTSETRPGSNPTYGDLSTVGPSITLPLAGDYNFDFGAIGNQGGAGDGLMSFAIGGSAAADSESLFMNGAGYGSRTKFVTRNVPTASSAIVCKYRNTSTGATDYRGRWLKIIPVRAI